MKKTELFVNEKALHDFICAYIKEKIGDTFSHDKKGIISLDNNTNIRYDFYVSKGQWLKNNSIPEEYNIDSAYPVVFEIKKKLNSINTIDKLFNRLNKDFKGKATLIIVAFNDISYSFKISAKERYENIVFWDKEIIENLVNTNPVLYLKTTTPDRIFNNIIVDDIRELDLQKQKENLKKQLENIVSVGDFSLVLGAGVSCSENAKGWSELLEEIEKRVTRDLKISSNGENLIKKIGESKLMLAQLQKELLSKKSYYETIYKSLYTQNKIPLGSNTLAEVVARLIEKNSKYRNFKVMTYNYDNFIELYLDNKIEYDVIFDEAYSLHNRLPIYHVHGFLPYITKQYQRNSNYENSIKLTEDDYNKLYNDVYSWQIGIQLSFFREGVCLFIGCSLTDPNIRRLLRMARQDDKKHFAIICKENMNLMEQKIATNHFYQMGVEVIWVDNYIEIRDIVENL